MVDEGVEGESRCRFRRKTSDAVDFEEEDDDDDFPKVLIVSIIRICVLWG